MAKYNAFYDRSTAVERKSNLISYLLVAFIDERVSKIQFIRLAFLKSKKTVCSANLKYSLSKVLAIGIFRFHHIHNNKKIRCITLLSDKMLKFACRIKIQRRI